ncbi:MAG TPA: addiction module protein [Mucilaginibacter sp.]|jgi:putative addiction module component (TIGR02574 family)|nr:addiction module protein [Mucilaginibacter sp.]
MAQKLDPDILRVELRYYIDNASDQELQELYDFIDSKTPRYEWWNDEEFVAELERRSADLESGKDKGVSWEEVKERLTSKYRKHN